MIRTLFYLRMLYLLCSLVFTICSIRAQEHKADSSKKELPNILVLVADDAGWADFGTYGNELIRTPNIDALAGSGLKVEQAFLTTSSCSPSRISILTGKYPHETGTGDLNAPLPENEKFISFYLQEIGYFTGHMRKRHYGPNGDKQFNWFSGKVNRFSDFLNASGERPFFLWVGFIDSHRPFTADDIEYPHKADRVFVPPYLADTPQTRKDLASYYNEISRMDADIGIFMEELEKRGIRNNTLVVFLSDNGAPFPRAKGTVYDAGIRTPLIFSWPEAIEPGTVYKGLTSVIDLAPTLLDVAGIVLPEDMSGESIKGIFKNQDIRGRDYVFSQRNWHVTDEHIRSVRTSKYKFILNAYTELPHGTPPDIMKSLSWKSLVSLKKKEKLSPLQDCIFKAPRPVMELYDMENDPWETENLAQRPEYGSVVKELHKVLNRWRKETGDHSPAVKRKADQSKRF